MPCEHVTRSTHPRLESARRIFFFQVLRGEPYNAKVDMFSFGVVVYQIFCKQDIASRFHTEEEVLNFAKSVARGRRLAMPKSLPPPLVALINELWADDPRVRPTAAKSLAALQSMRAQMDRERAVGSSVGKYLPSACLCMTLNVIAE
jgi:hypothetical protein